MLILILIDVKYLQTVVFSFEKGSNSKNHSSSGSQHPIEKSLQQSFSDFSPLDVLALFRKPWNGDKNMIKGS